MRVVLVGPLPPPSGGMANQTLQLGRLLSEEGVHVETIQVNVPYRPALIGKIRGLRALFRLVPYLCKLWMAAGKAEVMHVMANSGWSWHLFSAPAIWIGKLRGTPVVINYRGGFAHEFMNKQGMIVAFSIKRAAKLIVPSGFLKKVFGDFGLDSEVIPNVVDTVRFKRSGVADLSQQLILVTRNLEAIYGNDIAIKALKLVRATLPKAQMVIAGTGPEERKLRALANELGVEDAVEFTGRIDAKDMPAQYHRASIALNPSFVDNMPNSVLEALASGTPVVSTNVGGVPFMVKHEVTALLIPPGNETEMAQAMIKVLTDKSLAERLSANGVELVKQYDWINIKEKLLSLYKLVSPSPKREQQ